MEAKELPGFPGRAGPPPIPKTKAIASTRALALVEFLKKAGRKFRKAGRRRGRHRRRVAWKVHQHRDQPKNWHQRLQKPPVFPRHDRQLPRLLRHPHRGRRVLLAQDGRCRGGGRTRIRDEAFPERTGERQPHERKPHLRGSGRKTAGTSSCFRSVNAP